GSQLQLAVVERVDLRQEAVDLPLHVGEAAALLAQRSVDSSPEVHPEAARLPVQLLEVLAVDEGFREELARILTERHRLRAHAVRSAVRSPSEGTLGADRALPSGAPVARRSASRTHLLATADVVQAIRGVRRLLS